MNNWTPGGVTGNRPAPADGITLKLTKSQASWLTVHLRRDVKDQEHDLALFEMRNGGRVNPSKRSNIELRKAILAQLERSDV